MFVFDVSDTEPIAGALPLPRQVTDPYEVLKGHVGSEWERTIENAKRDGVRVTAAFRRVSERGVHQNDHRWSISRRLDSKLSKETVCEGAASLRALLQR
jgi:hypothetical protein